MVGHGAPAAWRYSQPHRGCGPRYFGTTTFPIGQFEIESSRQSASDDVLELHRVRPIAVEPVRPDFRACSGVDQPRVDGDRWTGSARCHREDNEPILSRIQRPAAEMSLKGR